MQNDPVQEVLKGAKNVLQKGNNSTENVEGNPTFSFSPPAIKKPSIPQAKEPREASYSLAYDANKQQ